MGICGDGGGAEYPGGLHPERDPGFCGDEDPALSDPAQLLFCLRAGAHGDHDRDKVFLPDHARHAAQGAEQEKRHARDDHRRRGCREYGHQGDHEQHLQHDDDQVHHRRRRE